MSWQQVARKDFEDAIRSKMLWAIMVVFVGFLAFLLVLTSLQNSPSAGENLTFNALLFIALIGQLFAPLLALIAGYMAIVGERRAGSLRLLLSYPHSRRDVVAGKLLGRSAVIAVTAGAGFVVNVVLMVVLFGVPEFEMFARILGGLTLLSLTFVTLSVGISAGTTSRGKAMALAIGLFLVCFVFWDAAAAVVYSIVTGSLPGLQVEAWYLLLKQLNPLGAYRTIVSEALGLAVPPMFQLGLEQISPVIPLEDRMFENRVEGSLPFYLSDWFAVVILAVWGAIPPVLGYLRFERSDL